jgi:hypothetical protein
MSPRVRVVDFLTLPFAGRWFLDEVTCVVIPNEVRNPSRWEYTEQEGFLGTQRASVHRERSP